MQPSRSINPYEHGIIIFEGLIPTQNNTNTPHTSEAGEMKYEPNLNRLSTQEDNNLWVVDNSCLSSIA
jgi:hypothetical protein